MGRAARSPKRRRSPTTACRPVEWHSRSLAGPQGGRAADGPALVRLPRCQLIGHFPPAQPGSPGSTCSAVPAVQRRCHVGERRTSPLLVGFTPAPRKGVTTPLLVGIDAVTELVVRELVKPASTPPTTTRSTMSVTSSNGRRPFGEPGCVAAEQAEAARLVERRRRHAGVHAQEVGDHLVVGAGRGDRRGVGDQRQQVGPRRRRDGELDADGRVRSLRHACDQRVERGGGELRVVLWIAATPQVLEAGADDQFVEQRVAHALYLNPVAVP